MFPHPPLPGTDREYDGLIRCLIEAEDSDEAQQIELALGILLLSRNYAPRPDEYEAIFSFGENKARGSAARAAISELILESLEKRRFACAQRRSRITLAQVVSRALRKLCDSCAARFRSTWRRSVPIATVERPSPSRKLARYNSFSNN